MNDAGYFILMERIEPGTAYDMPKGTVILADKGYGDFVPLFYTIPGCTNQTNANASAATGP